MDKEQKAKEYFKDEVNEFGDPAWDEEKIHWARKGYIVGFDEGFEAGKQERDRDSFTKEEMFEAYKASAVDGGSCCDDIELELFFNKWFNKRFSEI